MTLSNPKHPIWPIVRYSVVASTMIILCNTLYKNGFDPKDLVLILSTLASLAGFDAFRNRVQATGKESSEDSQPGSQTIDKG